MIDDTHLREKLERAAAAQRAWLLNDESGKTYDTLEAAMTRAAAAVVDHLGYLHFGAKTWMAMSGTAEYQEKRKAERAAEVSA